MHSGASDCSLKNSSCFFLNLISLNPNLSVHHSSTENSMWDALWFCCVKCLDIGVHLSCSYTKKQYKSINFSKRITCELSNSVYLFIYLGFNAGFNTVQVISQRIVGRAEETTTYSWSRFCTVSCQPKASNYQLYHLRLGQEPNPDLRGGRRESSSGDSALIGLQILMRPRQIMVKIKLEYQYKFYQASHWHYFDYEQFIP